jgi:hypothetical protein
MAIRGVVAIAIAIGRNAELKWTLAPAEAVEALVAMATARVAAAARPRTVLRIMGLSPPGVLGRRLGTCPAPFAIMCPV